MTTNKPDDDTKGVTLSHVFNLFAEAAVKNFPQLAGALVIVNQNGYNYIVFPLGPDLKKTGFESVKDFEEQLGKTAPKRAENDNHCYYHFVKEHNLHVIDYHHTKQTLETQGEVHGAIFILDHELGHGVAPHGNYPDTEHTLERKNLSESIADAYAMLRHYHLYGTKTGYDTHIMRDRTLAFLSDPSSFNMAHYSTPVLEVLKDNKDKIDVKALGAPQAARLADRLALRYAPKQELMDDLAAAFNPFAEAMKTNDPGKSAEALAKATLHGDYAVFRAGKDLLSDLMERKYGLRSGERVVSYLSPANWKKERALLKAKEDILARKGEFAGFPLAGETPANRPPPMPRGPFKK